MLPLALLLCGCEQQRIQSALHPAGPAAARIADLWWFMLGILTLAFVIVIGFLFYGLSRPAADAGAGAPDPETDIVPGTGPAPEPPLGSTRFIVAGGVLLPSVVLLALLLKSVQTTVELRMPEDTTETIQVIGHRWWWEVRYPEYGIVTANELYIPVGEAIRIELRSADVIHSFWVPELHGKMDMLPEDWNLFWVRADRVGQFRGQCAEFCGLQHARMAFMVVALNRPQFEEWVAARVDPPPAPEPGEAARGLEVFFEAGCHNCHRVAGTAADGLIGPDLTHIGTRLTLGAGTVPNTPGNLAGWVTNPQTIKPGNKMPITFLEPPDLHALRTYLETLE